MFDLCSTVIFFCVWILAASAVSRVRQCFKRRYQHDVVLSTAACTRTLCHLSQQRRTHGGKLGGVSPAHCRASAHPDTPTSRRSTVHSSTAPLKQYRGLSYAAAASDSEPAQHPGAWGARPASPHQMLARACQRWPSLLHVQACGSGTHTPTQAAGIGVDAAAPAGRTQLVASRAPQACP
jgi:hypothetical protein